MSVKNIGYQAQNYFGQHQKLIDASGRTRTRTTPDRSCIAVESPRPLRLRVVAGLLADSLQQGVALPPAARRSATRRAAARI